MILNPNECPWCGDSNFTPGVGCSNIECEYDPKNIDDDWDEEDDEEIQEDGSEEEG